MRSERLQRRGRRDVARCLDVLLAADQGAIPAYAELATYDGTDVIVFGLVVERT